jgi:hypothetical protein
MTILHQLEPERVPVEPERGPVNVFSSFYQESLPEPERVPVHEFVSEFCQNGASACP